MRIKAGEPRAAGVKSFTIDDHDYKMVAFEADDVEGWADCYKWEGYPAAPIGPVNFTTKADGDREVVRVYGKVMFEFDEPTEDVNETDGGAKGI